MDMLQPNYGATVMNKDNAKVLAMLALGGGSLLSGLLGPGFCGNRGQRNHQLLISIFLCFGAGVLLATSLVHMLPEVREKMAQNTELIFSCGFFIVYVVDELVHFLFGEALRHEHDSTTIEAHHHPSQSSRTYGSTETQPLLQKHENQAQIRSYHEVDTIRQEEELADEEANARICHTAHTEPCGQSLTGHAGLLCALSLHSILEGLAIGVQDSSTKVLLLLGAVSTHKFVVGFCLGIELSSTPGSLFKNQLLAILIFSLGSVFGIGIGMAIVDIQIIYEGPTISVLQAIAGGTLLYVTVSEILPREKSRWHMRPPKISGILQCLAVLIGFSIMSVMSFYMNDD